MSRHKSQFGFTTTPTWVSLQGFFESMVPQTMHRKNIECETSNISAVKTRPMLVSGFTIMELLVTLGIFTMMTSVVLVNYRSFNVNSDFANSVESAYFALREAQVYGVGTRTTGVIECGTPPSSFNCAYGVRFVNGSGSYDFFVDKNENRIFDTGAIAEELIQTISLGGGTTVTSLICIRSSGTGACGASGVNITFKRPSPETFIAEGAFPANSNLGVEVTISNGIKAAKVVISGAGQMSIQ